jgi:Protein of unknown function (DUF2769).
VKWLSGRTGFLIFSLLPIPTSPPFSGFRQPPSGYIFLKSQIPKSRETSEEGYYPIPVTLLYCEKTMKTRENSKTVEDTEENLEICNCRACPTFKNNNLAEYPPNALFCAREKSSIPSKVKLINCYCPACEVFSKYGLVISQLCINK